MKEVIVFVDLVSDDDYVDEVEDIVGYDRLMCTFDINTNLISGREPLVSFVLFLTMSWFNS